MAKFSRKDVLTWSITHQEYPLILWKTCFRCLSSFSSMFCWNKPIGFNILVWYSNLVDTAIIKRSTSHDSDCRSVSEHKHFSLLSFICAFTNFIHFIFFLFYICAFYLSIDCVAYLYINPHLENILTFLFSKRF